MCEAKGLFPLLAMLGSVLVAQWLGCWMDSRPFSYKFGKSAIGQERRAPLHHLCRLYIFSCNEMKGLAPDQGGSWLNGWLSLGLQIKFCLERLEAGNECKAITITF